MSTDARLPDALASGRGRAPLAFPAARRHGALRPAHPDHTTGAAVTALEVLTR